MIELGCLSQMGIFAYKYMYYVCRACLPKTVQFRVSILPKRVYEISTVLFDNQPSTFKRRCYQKYVSRRR